MDTGRVKAKSYMTMILIAINTVIYFITSYDKAFSGVSDYWVNRAALVPITLVEPSEWYRLLTSMFLHGDIFHIFFNMYFLYLFGREVEGVLGSQRFLTVYMLSGLVASIFHTAFIPVTGIQGLFIPALGASGAISGILGAYLLLFPRKKMSVCWFSWIPFCFTTKAAYFLIFWFATQVMYGYSRLGGVAFFAHVGGFVGGMALLALLIPDWVKGIRFRVSPGIGGYGYFILGRGGLGKISKWILVSLLVILTGGVIYSLSEAGTMSSEMYIYTIEAAINGVKATDIAVYDAGDIVLSPSSDAARVALNRLYWAGLLKGTPNTISDSFRYKGIVRASIGNTPVSVRLQLEGKVRYDEHGVLTRLMGRMVTDVIKISILGGVIRLERNIAIDVNLSAEGPLKGIGYSLIFPTATLALTIILVTTYVVMTKDKEIALV